jgi:hypothetical protein
MIFFVNFFFVHSFSTSQLKRQIKMLGFSAHTLTKVGKGTEDPSPWLNKLERYNTNALNTTKLTQAHTYTSTLYK